MHRTKLLIIILVTLIMLVLVELHVRHVEGPWYGFVYWRRYPAALSYGLMLASAIPTIAGVLLWNRVARFKPLLLILPMLSTFAGKIAYSEVHSLPGPHLKYIADAVQHPLAVSYYVDAGALSNFPGWLADFPSIMPLLHIHSVTKAPGMILYYMAFIKTLGYNPGTALISGLVLGVICTLPVLACYWFLLVLLDDRQAAFLGSCFLSLCPGFVMMFPASDPAYAIFSCLAGVFWIRAMQRDRIGWSIATGALTAAALLVSFHVLIFGAFPLAYTFFFARPSARKLLKHVAIAVCICAALCTLLWYFSGYNPITTFESAWRNLKALARVQPRPYPTTIWNDLLDYALGTGWISFVLVACAMVTLIREGDQKRLILVLLCLALPIAIALAALLPSETARIWNFLYPLLMVPIGIELARYRTAERLIVFGCLALIAAAICRNMSVFM